MGRRRQGKKSISTEGAERPLLLTPWQMLCMQHLYAMVTGLGRLCRAPMISLMTLAVIAIAFALPMSLFVVLKNMQHLSQRLGHGTQLTIFLREHVDMTTAETLAAHLRQRPDVAGVRLISPAEGLKDFESRTGFAGVVSVLQKNPLPVVIEIYPYMTKQSSMVLQDMALQFKMLLEVDTVQLDLQWIQRIHTMAGLAKRLVLLLTGLFAAAVYLIVGYSIRMTVEHSRDEISVLKLIGGTDSFIQRPYLYVGFLYGLCGALLATVIVVFGFYCLHAPLLQLSKLYNSDLHFAGLQFADIAVALTIGIVLGVIGAKLAVTRQLESIEPGSA